MKRVLTALVFFAVLVAAWEVVYYRGIWSPVLVPGPGKVARYLWGALLDGTLGASTLVTMKRLLAGYIIGLAIGLPLGLLTAHFRPVHDTLGVLALGLQGLPSVCWVPLALL